jgi:hypothetical protein
MKQSISPPGKIITANIQQKLIIERDTLFQSAI